MSDTIAAARDALITRVIHLTPEVSIEFDLPVHLFESEWGIRQGQWDLWDPAEKPWTYTVWARWWVDQDRQVRALLVPDEDSPWDSQRLVVRGSYRSLESPSRASNLPTWARC